MFPSKTSFQHTQSSCVIGKDYVRSFTSHYTKLYSQIVLLQNDHKHLNMFRLFFRSNYDSIQYAIRYAKEEYCVLPAGATYLDMFWNSSCNVRWMGISVDLNCELNHQFFNIFLVSKFILSFLPMYHAKEGSLIYGSVRLNCIT